ncbi:hypothetical protein [Pedomonas mirosovicensis]|uniref:hypothetical protein n=1 Tax=Pedomonas mirosovicensis TaxID=2908641 RepID=UPI002169BFF9|nr:hypothetical protein [Pedomonas mirosovicensis]MCH8685874.1 hypothetical protein [Pedomonas mirosovicensis]
MDAELKSAAFEIARRVAACPHSNGCRAEFYGKARSGEQRHIAPVPSPDFIGSRYSGLVIIGGNPGLAHHDIHHANDRHMFDLQRKIAAGDQAAFDELLEFMPRSMAHWPQVVDSDGRQRLQYDIEEIAYVNLVKCGTIPGKGNTHSLFNGTGILNRCWEQHTRQLLELLRPTHVLALWKPIVTLLEGLDYPIQEIEVGYHNGARQLTKDERYATARHVIDSFYGRATSS